MQEACYTLVAKQAGRRPQRGSEARISRLDWGVLKLQVANGRVVNFKSSKVGTLKTPRATFQVSAFQPEPRSVSVQSTRALSESSSNDNISFCTHESGYGRYATFSSGLGNGLYDIIVA